MLFFVLKKPYFVTNGLNNSVKLAVCYFLNKMKIKVKKKQDLLMNDAI